ncbi:MAG: two-component system sensor histidine kinase BaeS [Lentisphaeria bacterium]|jgi:two-component system sensor histidine kinase BaeS
MIKSIKLKLWLTFFVTLVLSLGSLLLLTHLSVKQRFLEYATKQILERLEPLEQAVINEYATARSLRPFLENGERWNTLRDATYRQYLRHQNLRSPPPLGPRPHEWGDRESMEKKLEPNQRAFFQHLILVDNKKQLVAGRQQEDANYIYRQLILDNTIIAHIGYVKPKAFLRPVDKLFADQQLNIFGLLSVLMVFAALIVTLFVSRWLVTPLSKLSQNAKQMAAGDFTVRMASTADDELGTLCQNFDEMASTLEKNETARKQWVANTSHEMRTPLSVLKAQIEAMQDGIREASSENLNLLQRNVDSLSLIIDDLYELSLVDEGALSFFKEQFDIRELIKETSVEFEEKLAQKNLHLFTISDDEVDLCLFADRKRIKQLLGNLLENSFRYTNANGTIKISLLLQKNEIHIHIEDSAPGVPDDGIEKIFDRLYRIETSRNRETGGAGLGLSICKGIVEGHGGTITARASMLGGIKQIITMPK